MSADTLALQSRIAHVLNRRPAVGLAVAIVRQGALASFAAHGLADIPRRRPVTRDTVFRIASITKTFTAVAVMQLWEQGLVDLDAPANDYLRAFRLVRAQDRWPQPTLRHAHAHRRRAEGGPSRPGASERLVRRERRPHGPRA